MDDFFFIGGMYKSQYAICSDNRCPCPQVMIRRGEGYIYVEDRGNGRFVANITCEEGARLRNLDLKVARQDAIRWWNTGMVPKRETPKSTVKLEPKRDEAGYAAAKAYKDWRLSSMQNIPRYNSDYIFFDTETTGVPRNYKAPYTDTNNWPRIVQISWLVVSKDKAIIRQEDHIIKPEGFIIPTASSNIHGITQERAIREGKSLKTVMDKFCEDLSNAKFVVGHNVSFDINVSACECFRLQKQYPFTGKQILCTMQSSTNFCRIPGPYGYKWPKLDELHMKLFGRHFNDAHNSLADIKATFDCFWKMREIGII